MLLLRLIGSGSAWRRLGPGSCPRLCLYCWLGFGCWWLMTLCLRASLLLLLLDVLHVCDHIGGWRGLRLRGSRPLCLGLGLDLALLWLRGLLLLLLRLPHASHASHGLAGLLVLLWLVRASGHSQLPTKRVLLLHALSHTGPVLIGRTSLRVPLRVLGLPGRELPHAWGHVCSLSAVRTLSSRGSVRWAVVRVVPHCIPALRAHTCPSTRARVH